MGDILSQSDIDNLLRQLTSGELDAKQLQTSNNEKKITTYKFERPNKFAKEHIRTMHNIHENYARAITNYLSGYLRTSVQVDVFNVEELPYNDFHSSIQTPSMLAIADFTPLSGSIILEIQPQIAFGMIERLLGGKGWGVEKIREFTEIERAILDRIVIQLLNMMREPWENVIQLRPRLERTETNRQFAQILSPNDMIALVTFNVRIGDVEGTMNLCIPHMVVEPVTSKLSTRFWYASKKKEITPETIENIEKKVSSVKVPVRTVLGKSTITVSDFLELQKGDVIQLDTQVNDDLEIMVGDLLKFYAKPGVKKNRLSVKITKVVRKEVD